MCTRGESDQDARRLSLTECMCALKYGRSDAIRDHAFSLDSGEDAIQWIIQKRILDCDHGFVTKLGPLLLGVSVVEQRQRTEHT